MHSAPELIHGTVVAHGDDAALIRGPSGAGKSDLALRCLTHAQSPMIPGPIRLVSDDYAQVTRNGSGLDVSPPKTIAGKLEVRGLGIIEVEPNTGARLVMVVDLVAPKKNDLVAPEDIERLPDLAARVSIQGVQLPVIKLHAFENSAATKLLLALARGGQLPSQG